MNRTSHAIVAAVGFIAAIVAANWLTTRFGFVPVGFGFEATAGTFAAGASLALRDLAHDTMGKRGVLVLIAAGVALSFALSDPFIAIASAAAFGIAELADYAVYAPLRNRSRLGDRRWATAVVASNAVGAVVDTVVFLGIAFGAAAILPALAGQLIGKGWATIAYLITGKAASVAVPSQPLRAEGGASHA